MRKIFTLFIAIFLVAACQNTQVKNTNPQQKKNVKMKKTIHAYLMKM